MGIQVLSSALVGIVACFPVMTATASQVHPACAPTVALTTDSKQSSVQVTLVRDRIRMSGLKSAEIRSRLANVGYEPSVLDRYLDPTCSVPAPTDTVQHALEALGLMDSSGWTLQPGASSTAPEVTIAGEVQRPVAVEFREGMTLGDLITAAGRLKRTADITLEVYRVMGAASQELFAIPEIHSIRVDSAYLVGHDPNRIYANHIPGFTYIVDRAAAFKLMPYDRVVANVLHRAQLLTEGAAVLRRE